MVLRILANVFALALLVAYLGPVAVKLRDIPLIVVVLGGVALAAADAWQSLRSRKG